MLNRAGCCFGTVTDTELGEDTADIISDRALTQEESFGNFAIGLAFRYQHKDMTFLLSKGRKSRGFFIPGCFTEFLKNPLSDSWIEQCFTSRNSLDSTNQVFSPDLF